MRPLVLSLLSLESAMRGEYLVLKVHNSNQSIYSRGQNKRGGEGGRRKFSIINKRGGAYTDL